jgi:hypothetical protein
MKTNEFGEGTTLTHDSGGKQQRPSKLIAKALFCG